MKIKAAVLNGAHQKLQVTDVELDAPKENEVLVKIIASGICHSDTGPINNDRPGLYPTILGHEGAGIIEKVGPNVNDFSIGDHVVVSFASCGKCKFCRAGLPGACLRWGQLNSGPMYDGTYRLHTEDGQNIAATFGQSSLATYSVTNVRNLVKVDPKLDLRYLGPLGCGFMTGAGTVLHSLKPEIDDTIAVFGVGGVGLTALMAARLLHCRHIIAVDIHQSRLKIAQELGATEVIDSSTDDVAARIKEITNGMGLNYAIDTSGVAKIITIAMRSLAIKGTLVTLAAAQENIAVNPALDLMAFSHTLQGVIEGDSVPQIFIPQMIQLFVQNDFPIDKLCKFYTLDQVNEAFADSASGKTIKPIIVMDPAYQA
ncbi:NAD(P)-dependent alcohol dehydrogenase [Lactobacillus sp. ESL0791]|uniref:NAD(P)-dependent alcohol dehydrogenase n=1 Tax=Lactobacillus sp. ESL0791 TaxID=2983234 RepID=UPI0023F740F9|nr:NAD(P)-dependent alcohol dehydrogenase [Lactobacillus sp. ESL0791]MDF7638240.1 NAD(P)-dependent alcohol dehydrogenase [Lactobacillus sp. ESL0791]